MVKFKERNEEKLTFLQIGKSSIEDFVDKSFLLNNSVK